MKIVDYNFIKYQEEFNNTAREILKESYGDDFDAQEVSDQIDEAQITYNKIQKILNCPEMIKSHAYLYALDMENVDECDKKKIDKLYELGKARGVIQEDEPDDVEDTVDECDFDDEICGGPNSALTNQEMSPGETKPVLNSSAFTVLYSAMKDGQVKTGEYFSSATDMESAKKDCISNLSPLGYSSIRILGIEQTNNAVDLGYQNLDEDDSKEYEEQETGSGDSESDEQKSDEKQSGEQKPDETKSKEEDSEQKEDSDTNVKSDDNQEDKESTEKTDADDSNKEEQPEEKTEKKELTASQKQVLKDEYIGMFKSELQKMKLEKSVEDMNIKEKAEFWGNIVKKWTKQDPEEFLSDREIEKLNKTVIKNS